MIKAVNKAVIIDKALLEEILDDIRDSIGYKVEHIEGLTSALRIIIEHLEQIDGGKVLKLYGNRIAIQEIINSIDDVASDMLFNGTWDAERHFQYIKDCSNILKGKSKDDISELTVNRNGITKAE